jgi:ATP-dependent helicase/nuclease subunit B
LRYALRTVEHGPVQDERNSRTRRLLISPRASDRIATARSVLEAQPASGGALVLAPTQEAADEFVRNIASKRGASFAVERLMFNRLIGLLASWYAAEHQLAFVTRLGAQALAARAVFRMKGDARVRWFGEVIELPGFARALASAYDTLRHNRVDTSRLRELDRAGEALVALFEQIEAESARGGFLDRAGMITAAIDALGKDEGRRFSGVPVILLDVPIDSILERDFIAALADHSPAVLATVPSGDNRSEKLLARALRLDDHSVEHPEAAVQDNSFARLQQYLFTNASIPESPLDDSVIVRSAAGEMQECVEIARQIHAEVKRGIPFDRIAVLLHAPERYVPYLKEALERAGVPAWFARGASIPEPGGRALLALLNCAAERFSARRFAEYLSLGQLPDPAEQISNHPSFVPAEADFMPAGVELAATSAEESDPSPEGETSVRAPWRWEKLLVDASVVGGRDRWEKRLRGLENELRAKRDEVADDDIRAAALDRNLADLAHLSAAALPIIGALAGFPERATWGEWLEQLRSLTALAIRDHSEVERTLAELEPMAPVGPITLDEVRIVLSERLGRLPSQPSRRRYGEVFVAPTSHARGLDFEVVMVPGLAERVFPKKLTEDPLLPDAVRRRLDGVLPLQAARVEDERLALRVAAGCARRGMFSYPRIDLDQGRPRVPSFYALEILQAAEGRLPGFDELAKRAAGDRVSRLGWPTPEHPQEAIDEIEFDLAVLDQLVDQDPDTTIGAAHYLLDDKANPHLGRALRARGRRWLLKWTPNDGLAEPDAAQIAALSRHQLGARSYSPTALQNYAACPYRFFLQAILRLEPREEIQPIEAIDPLTRGALFHQVQFETLSALRAAGLLPVIAGNIEPACDLLEEKLASVAARMYEQLAPAIERVWLDGIESIRADLREWIRRMAAAPQGYSPARFELAFGLSDRDQADPASIVEPVALAAGIKVRGSIDLVERMADGKLRVTDHKTGRVRADKELVIGGGKTLQPVLYGLAAEQILNETVAAGRLYYCTAAGGYEERIVMLDDFARSSAAEFVRIIGKALNDGFLPAAPDQRECDFCDYRRVCGPYEETRVQRKLGSANSQKRMAELMVLRGMR